MFDGKYERFENPMERFMRRDCLSTEKLHWYDDECWDTPSNTLWNKDTPRANIEPEWANFGQQLIDNMLINP